MVRHGENQRAKEKAQKEAAKEFVNPFTAEDLNVVPTREGLHDIWLLVDYWINYQPILSMQNVKKLKKKRAILVDICDRMTKGNPISNLFLGIVEEKLGNKVEADRRRNNAQKYLADSAYWQKQFQALDLYGLCS